MLLTLDLSEGTVPRGTVVSVRAGGWEVLVALAWLDLGAPGEPGGGEGGRGRRDASWGRLGAGKGRRR